MDSFIKQIIEEKFASKKQAAYFYAKSEDKSTTKKERSKWKKWAKEFSDNTDFKKIPKKIEKEIDEIVDEEGNIISGDDIANPNSLTMSKSTSDEVAKTGVGQMGAYGSLGGASGGVKMTRYWTESDQSKSLGYSETMGQDLTYDEAKDHLEDDLELSPEEAEDRVEKMGYDPDLPEGKVRLIENPKKFIEEYLAQKSKDGSFVKKPIVKDEINPIILKQLNSIKQTLKSNNLTVKDVLQYLEDNE